MDFFVDCLELTIDYEHYFVLTFVVGKKIELFVHVHLKTLVEGVNLLHALAHLALVALQAVLKVSMDPRQIVRKDLINIIFSHPTQPNQMHI